VSRFSTVSTALNLNRLPDIFLPRTASIPRGSEGPGFGRTALLKPSRALPWRRDPTTESLTPTSCAVQSCCP
jgi:hypothetical protein